MSGRAAGSAEVRTAPRISVRRWIGDPGSASRWETIFLFLVAGLTSTIRLKVAGIQYMELLYMLQMGILLLRFRRMGLRVTMLGSLRWLALGYALFLVTALALAAAALRFDFYFVGGEPPLIRRPFWIAVSRSIELLGNSTMLIYLAESFRRSRDKLRFVLRVYFWTGMASVGFALVSLPILKYTGHDFGAYDNFGVRLRGFLNEGGPFGLYLISLFLTGRALYLNGWETRRRVYACFALVVWALVGATSKAAMVALVVLVILNAILAGTARQRLVLGVATVAVFVVALRAVDFGRFLRAYRAETALYEQNSLYHRGDPNYVEGRVGGAFIVPRMIAAHPLTGIGWGNYGYLRNDPEYRGASAWSTFADDPGLGIYGSTADFGIPLQALMLICLMTPFFVLRSRRAPNYMLNLALLQPVSHLFGAQLNVTYVWVVTALAIGFAFNRQIGGGTEVVGSLPARAPRMDTARGGLVVA